MNRGYKPGQYNVICDQCGRKFKSGRCKLQWNGLFVCRTCWEPRQPQDFTVSATDNQRVPIARPPQTDRFVEAGDITQEDL